MKQGQKTGIAAMALVGSLGVMAFSIYRYGGSEEVVIKAEPSQENASESKPTSVTVPAKATASAAPTADSPPSPKPAPDPEPEPKSQMAQVRSWSPEDALRITTPAMEDSVGKLDSGTIALMVWADAKLKWENVKVLRNETTRGKVRKDSVPERGKRMCVQGIVKQIMTRRDKTPDDKPLVYAEGLLSVYRDYYWFIAVGSTGELVENRLGKFCGYVTGEHAFSNVSGGQTQTVKLVGMFDLPENREERK